MVGKWDKFHATETHPYGNVATYKRAAEWLTGHGLVEDWGCGRAYFKQFVPLYRGVDGSGTTCDERVDLSNYRSNVPCILIRHVLEHNVEWRKILENALCSFTERMVLILFLMPDEEDSVRWMEGDIPYISLCARDLVKMLIPYLRTVIIEGNEIVICLEKPHETV